jgi:large subunit ribosomal protein L13
VALAKNTPIFKRFRMATKKTTQQQTVGLIDMNNAFFMRKEDRKPAWKVIDAQGKVLGRLATHIATMLRGKDKSLFTPHTDCGDYIVIVNADKVVLTGNKWNDKEYIRHTLYMGGKKIETARQLYEKKPTELIMRAVKRMLPKNRLNRDVLTKLKIYVGDQHPHRAQNPETFTL